jgi:hypothetical protein
MTFRNHDDQHTNEERRHHVTQQPTEDELTQLREQVTEQATRLDRMDGIVRRLLGGNGGNGATSRRNFVRMAGAGVIGAAGAAALIPRGASAATGGTNGTALILGANNGDGTANQSTEETAWDVVNGNSNTTVTGLYLYGDTSSAGTVDAFVGEAVNSGTAVTGASDYGLDLKATGTGRLSQINVGDLNGGAPQYSGGIYDNTTFSPYVVAGYELVRGENGEIWAALNDAYESNQSSPQGGYFWKRLNSARFDNPIGDGSTFVPFRAYDSRVNPGHPIASGTIINIQIAPNGTNAGPSAGTIPSTAVGIAGNLTAVSPTGGGYLTIYPGPSSSTRPGTSTVNFVPGGAPTPNGFIVGLGSDGTVNVYVFGSSGQSVHVVVDVTAYFQ